MLIRNKSVLDKIVAFRTGSGEEIVGKLIEDNDTTFTIAKPITVHLQRMQEGGAAIAFAPFGLARTDDSDATFNKAALMTLPQEARDDIRSNYLKATTGLDLPPTSSLLKV